MDLKVKPRPMPETQPYWEAAERSELLITRCAACHQFFFPPSPVCPACTSRNVEWAKPSGRAHLYSYVVAQQAGPQWSNQRPQSVALVQLEEGPRLISTIVDCEQTHDALKLDMPLVATFKRTLEGVNLLCFKPAVEAKKS